MSLLACAFYAPQLVTGAPRWDGVEVHYAPQRFLSEAIRQGQLPFWTPYLFGGFPFLADIQVGAWYPLNWPFFLLGVSPVSIGFELLLHTLVACTGAYLLALRVLGSSGPALFAGLFYGLSGYFAAHSQHVGIFQAAAWLPWAVLLIDSIGEQITPGRLALAGALGAALALPGHFQTALYAFCGVAVWGLLEAAARRSGAFAGRVAVGLLAMGVWGGLLAAVMILPGMELAGQSVRTRIDASASSIGYFQPDSLLTLVQPNYYGLLAGGYTGPGDSTQHYFYAGILLVPLALLGLGHARARRMALFLMVPFLWYALGPAGGLFQVVGWLPGFRNVELPMHGWFLPALGLAVLGGAGASVVSRRVGSRALLALLALVFVDTLVVNSLIHPLAFGRGGDSFEAQYIAPLRAFASQVQSAEAVVERVYGPPLAAVGYRNHPLQSQVEATYGYNPLELAASADYAAAAEHNPRLVDGLAATHVLQDNTTLRPNPSALPLAAFAPRITVVPDSAASAARLTDLDPSRESVVHGASSAVPAQPDRNATVQVRDRGADYLTVGYRSSSPQVLRLAIPAFPGWQATLKGAPLEVLAVDHAFVGVLVPPGEGDVQLRYVPRFFALGAALSGAALLAIVATLVYSARFSRRRFRRERGSVGSEPVAGGRSSTSSSRSGASMTNASPSSSGLLSVSRGVSSSPCVTRPSLAESR